MSQGGIRSAGSGAAPVETLTGNSGGAVSPSGGNINVVGSGTITVTGNPGTSTLTISDGGVPPFTYTNVNTTPYVVLISDYYLSVDCSGGPITLQFPNAATLSQAFTVKDRTGNAAVNNITLTTVGGAVNIDSATTFAMNSNYESVNLVGNASTYEVF